MPISAKLFHRLLIPAMIGLQELFQQDNERAERSGDISLHFLAPDADWRSGRRFAGGTSREAIQAWIETLDLPVL